MMVNQIFFLFFFFQIKVINLIFSPLKPNEVIGVRYKKCNQIFNAFLTNNVVGGVILSSGTIGTPTILFNSNIGPNKLINIPTVGLNLKDHITTGFDLISVNIVNNNTNEINNINDILMNFKNIFWNYLSYGTGLLTYSGCELIGRDRTKKLGFHILSLGILSDRYIGYFKQILGIRQTIWTEYYQKINNDRKTTTTTLSIMPILLQANSNGLLFIDKNDDDADDMTTTMKINPNYLDNDEDINVLLNGIRIIQNLIKQPAMQQLNATINTLPLWYCNTYEFDTDNYWKCYIKYMTFTSYHSVGTCRMGINRYDGVVDTEFRVFGIKNGLWICDGSIIPNQPITHPMSIIYKLSKHFLSTLYRNEHIMYRNQNIKRKES